MEFHWRGNDVRGYKLTVGSQIVAQAQKNWVMNPIQ